LGNSAISRFARLKKPNARSKAAEKADGGGDEAGKHTAEGVVVEGELLSFWGDSFMMGMRTTRGLERGSGRNVVCRVTKSA